MYDNRHLILAVKESEKSDCHHKLGAVIFNGNKIISTGYNKVIPSEIEDSWTDNRILFKCSIHAEIMALIKAGKKSVGMELLVIRLRKNGALGNSKPCKHCMSYILESGIKIVYYSSDDEQIYQLRVR